MEIEENEPTRPFQSKMNKSELKTFIDKFLFNMVEDTIDEIEEGKIRDRDLENHLKKTSNSIKNNLVLAPKPDEKKIKTMLKVLHNVPLISYIELECNGFTYPLIQMQVLQQQVYNLCGYHMIHNLMNFINYLKSVGKTSFLENINSSVR